MAKQKIFTLDCFSQFVEKAETAETDTKGQFEAVQTKTRQVTEVQNSLLFAESNILNQWNKLPKYVIGAKSTNAFKNEIDRHWKDTGVFKGIAYHFPSNCKCRCFLQV